MEGLSCAQARQRLREVLQAGQAVDTQPDLLAHFSTCEVCRSALLLITALDLSSVPEPIPCSRCQADLAAFIECERSEGPHGAIRKYASVWWHLWTCSACLEAYDTIQALASSAEASGKLPLPAHAASKAIPTPAVHLLCLTRQFLNIALPAPLPAVARGSHDGGLIISEGDAPGGAHFTLSVEAQRKGDWKIVVHVIPAPAGLLILTLGSAVFRARFDTNGNATIVDVPATLLTAINGPDMVVDIAPDDAARV